MIDRNRVSSGKNFYSVATKNCSSLVAVVALFHHHHPLSLSLSLPRTHSLTLSIALPHSLSLSQTPTHALSLSQLLSLTLSLFLSLPRTHSLTLSIALPTLSHPQKRSFSLTHTKRNSTFVLLCLNTQCLLHHPLLVSLSLTHTLTHARTHTYTHTHTFSLSLTHAHLSESHS